jgi:hypothetical protein
MTVVPCEGHLKVGHDGVDGRAERAHHLLSEVGIDGRGLRALVTEDFLNGPKVNASFNQYRCIGVSQRMHGGVFSRYRFGARQP